MTDSMLYNINNNKNRLDTLSNQYTTGKKIQKPSDDPIIAVRALKLRTNLSELNQYYEKNIPDALQWMSVTEGSMTTLGDILVSMNTLCDQGANDTNTATNRDSIVANLVQYKQQIYQEGNSNYAGRYVFSGYKTDTSLVFSTDTSDYEYSITEPLKGTDIDIITTLYGAVDISEFDRNDPDSWKTKGLDRMPETKNVYRLRLAYDGLESTPMQSFDISHTDAAGNVTITTFSNIKTISVTDKDAYKPDDDAVNFIHETGELIIGKNLYNDFRTASEIKVDYEKHSFNQNELRPEHYFNCKVVDKNDPTNPVTFTKANQEIKYEVNFNQKITINTQGDTLFSQSLGRAVDQIQSSVNDVIAVEKKMAEVKKMLEDKSLSNDAITTLNGIYSQLESEFTLRTSIMRETFAKGLTVTSTEQDRVNVALSDLGGRYNRLLMTQSRLSTQQVDFEELMSTNEEVDIVDTYVKLTSQKTIYDASLSSAAKLTGSTLLDFI